MTWTRDITEYRRDVSYVTLAFTLFVLVFKAIAVSGSETERRDKMIARTLMGQAKTWYDTSVQDKNPKLQSEHAAVALAYLHAARRVLNDSLLEQISGIDIHHFQNHLHNHQKSVSRALDRECPALAITNSSSSRQARAVKYL